MSYFTIIDKFMASPINDKRTHEEHHTRRYIFKEREHFTMEGQSGQKEHFLILINDLLILINDLLINDLLILIYIY